MFPDLIEKLTRREDLTVDEASAAMAEVMEGRAAPAQIAGLLIGLAMKGERPAEIVGLAKTMRAHAVQLSKRSGTGETVFDTCGTGGDRSGTFNISSCAAIVVAACGVKVAKHGNRSVSSRSGSADVFQALGVNVTAAPAVVERCLAEAGIGFFFAPTFHPSMRHAAQARRELGVRTAFNLLGPLTNPAGATRQLVGVPKAAPQALKGGDARENAAIIQSVLAGARGPARDVALLNTGAALFIAGAASSVEDGIARGSQALDRGEAKRTLDRLVAVSTAEFAAEA